MIRQFLEDLGLVSPKPTPGQVNLWFSIQAATPHRRLG